MSAREFRHAWTCPGCAKVYDLLTRIEERLILQERNPAPFIATEKMATERVAATAHARSGCARPV